MAAGDVAAKLPGFLDSEERRMLRRRHADAQPVEKIHQIVAQCAHSGGLRSGAADLAEAGRDGNRRPRQQAGATASTHVAIASAMRHTVPPGLRVGGARA